MKARDFLKAARVPESLAPQEFFPWTIQRMRLDAEIARVLVGFESYTLLRRVSWSTMHLESAGEIVMEDSFRELRRHLPIWLASHGRVLVTGLGLGCVVRGLLASPRVEHIDVIEIDRDILRVVGAEFAGDPRISLHLGDALEIRLPGTWNFAWHDLWTDGDTHLQCMHAKLFMRFESRCLKQGAWAFPREMSRLLPWRALGAPNYRRVVA